MKKLITGFLIALSSLLAHGMEVKEPRQHHVTITKEEIIVADTYLADVYFDTSRTNQSTTFNQKLVTYTAIDPEDSTKTISKELKTGYVIDFIKPSRNTTSIRIKYDELLSMNEIEVNGLTIDNPVVSGVDFSSPVDLPPSENEWSWIDREGNTIKFKYENTCCFKTSLIQTNLTSDYGSPVFLSTP